MCKHYYWTCVVSTCFECAYEKINKNKNKYDICKPQI